MYVILTEDDFIKARFKSKVEAIVYLMDLKARGLNNYRIKLIED